MNLQTLEDVLAESGMKSDGDGSGLCLDEERVVIAFAVGGL